jgi:DNA-binding response OmpR family regulator
VGTQRDYPFLQRLAQRLPAPSRLHVLIVDPDLQRAQLLADAIAHEHSVVLVATAAEALRAIEAQMPTILATELTLPDAQGLDLLAAVHTRPTTHHILLLALCERATVRDKIAAFQAGADDCLVKPVDSHVFAEHIARLSRFRQVLGVSAR